MTTTTIHHDERLKLKSWSDTQGKVTSDASYTVYPTGLVYIEPSPERQAYFKSLGLPLKKHFYELDLNNHPVGTVAKAFGLNYDDAGMRNTLASISATPLTGPRVLAMALEGIPGQQGRLESTDYRSVDYKAISSKSVLTDNGSFNPKEQSQGNVYTHQGLEYHEVLIRDDESLRHGYALTPESPKENGDRLAIYAGIMKSMQNTVGIQSDRVHSIRISSEGKPVLICYDASRPKIKIQDVIKMDSITHPLLKVKNEDIKATRFLSNAASEIHKRPLATFECYAEAKMLKSTAQASWGITVNQPGIIDDMVYVGRMQVPEGVSLSSFEEKCSISFKNAADYVRHESKIAGIDTQLHGKITERIEISVAQALNESRVFARNMESMMETAKAGPVEKKQRVKEYSIDELSI